MSKTVDRLILRPDPGDSPGSASTGETPLRNMSKAVAPRDTKPDSGRELANCNLSSIQGYSEKEARRGSRLKLGQSQNKLRMEIWAGVSRSRDFHEEPYARFPLWRNIRPFYSARQNARLAQNSSNWREASEKKGGRNLILATRECSSRKPSEESQTTILGARNKPNSMNKATKTR